MRYENKLSSEGSILPVLGMRVPPRDGNSDPIHPNFGSPSYTQLEPFKNGKTKRKKGQKPSKKGKNWNLATLSEIIAKLATLCQPSLFSRWDHQSSSPSEQVASTVTWNTKWTYEGRAWEAPCSMLPSEESLFSYLKLYFLLEVGILPVLIPNGKPT